MANYINYMGKRPEKNLIIGLDVGTSKIAAIVGEMTDDGGLDIIGLGLAESKGIRRGVVVNLDVVFTDLPTDWVHSANMLVVGFNFTFIPQFLLGNYGMPRRYYEYPERFQALNVASTAGATVLATCSAW